MKIRKSKKNFIILPCIFIILATAIVFTNIIRDSSSASADNIDWNVVNMDFPQPLKQLTMINSNIGWAITGDNEVLLTQDGGSIWDMVLQIDSINKNSDDFVNGFFLDETTAYIVFFQIMRGILRCVTQKIRALLGKKLLSLIQDTASLMKFL